MIKTQKIIVEQEIEVQCCDWCGQPLNEKDGMKNLHFQCRDFPQVSWDGCVTACGPKNIVLHYNCFWQLDERMKENRGDKD